MPALTTSDQATLKRLVGPTTFSRGRAYARRHAVRSREWRDDGTKAVGEIEGTESQPYTASVKLTRTPSQRLTSVTAMCTCPVGHNCKHAVALLLADDVASSAAPASVEPLRRPARWEASLRGLLPTAAPEPSTEEPLVGLQFELVATPKTARQAAATRVCMRPVVAGRGGNWVRSGISWSTLDYVGYQHPLLGKAAQEISLIKELFALSRAGATASSWSYRRPEETVWLDAIASRRVWDLLGEARGLGIPLLHAWGRPPRPVAFRPAPAMVEISVTRNRSGLLLEPRVSIDDEVIPITSSLLVGQPGHGIVWWDSPEGSPTANPTLSMASLATPLTDALRSLVRKGSALRVPSRDEERFLRDAIPALRRQVTVRSLDESVVLPDALPPSMLLTVSHHGDHRIGLAWDWARREEVGPGETENAIVDGLCRAVRDMPELLEITAFGEQLNPHAELAGMPAVRFLTDVLPVVRQLTGVEVSEDDSILDYREAGAAPAVVLSGSASGEYDWFDLSVDVSVEGEEVPFAELFVALAEGRSHLILPSGTYFSLDVEELRQLAELIAEAKGLHDGASGTVRLSRFQASLWEELRRLGILTAQARAWEESVQALTSAAERIDHAVPDGVEAVLRPYQHAGFNWLAYLYENGLGGILADDMGLGKTLQALALVCHTRQQGLTTAPFLVVAPTSVVENWASECRKFAPGLDTVTITETVARRGTKLDKLAATADIVITSYTLFRIEYGDYDAVEWAGMFLDEAQFAKNRHSHAYQKARMLPVRFKVAMTGTPMENNLMELWSLLSITAPGLFASPEHFTEYYRLPIERHGDPARLDQLRRRMRPLMVRRTKELVAPDLPDKQEQVLEMELNPKHRRMYQTHLQRERQKVLGLLADMTKNRFEILKSLTVLRQASLAPWLIDPKYANIPSTKLDALMEMVGDIVADGHRVLVFSQFTRFLGSARDRLQAAGVDNCYLDGKTRNRPEVISQFRTGGAPVFLISLKAGGFGLNLTEADYCILLDPWWNPATEAQAVDRVHRIGQTRKVMVYRMVAKDTIEEKVMALKARKSALFANVIDAGGFESGALTADDIRGLLS